MTAARSLNDSNNRHGRVSLGAAGDSGAGDVEKEMTSPDEIARGIIDSFQGQTFSSSDDALGWLYENFSAALRGYGEAVLRKQRDYLTGEYLQTKIKQADAEGFKRGEQAAILKTAAYDEGHRRGVEEQEKKCLEHIREEHKRCLHHQEGGK